MIELRDKLLEEVKHLKKDCFRDDYVKGYQSALESIAKDIDAQMIQKEREQLIDFAYCQLAEISSDISDTCYSRVPEEIYNEKYTIK